MTFLNPLPDDWKEVSSAKGEYPSWGYEHEYLDIDLRLIAYTTTQDLGIESEYEYVYDIFLQWSDCDGFGIEDNFEPETIIGREAGSDWCIAIMSNINRKFIPGDRIYVNRAMQATLGEEVDDPQIRNSTVNACPICEVSFMQYRGFEPLEKAKNHIAHSNDDEHNGVEVSVEEGL